MITATREKRGARKQVAPAVPLDDEVVSTEVSSYFRWKGAIERVLATLMLIAALPLMAIITVLVGLSSRGPAIFRQVRVGRGGKPFTMYKYRTMVHDAETKTGPVWAVANDPRLTRVGRIVRKTHLDELPQLWNVVRGEMSLVGPRPERPEFTHSLSKEVPGYAGRLAVLPGITGLAQINLPADSDLNSVRRKIVLDLEYIRQASFSIDIRLLLCTCFRAIGFSGYWASRLLSVRREVHLPADTSSTDEIQVAVTASERSRVNGHASVAALAGAASRPR
jgi:lipopolysaccharide/colanic/teichoic acid biosynthesis glycosyltransferase